MKVYALMMLQLDKMAVFHEIQHQRQDMLTGLNIGSKESMLYAKEFVLHIILEKGFYKDNYEVFGIENNANAVGYSEAIQLMNLENPVFLDLKESYEIEFETSLYRGKANTESGIEQLRFEDGIAREDLFEKAVSADIIGKKLLNLYPILNKEYEAKYNGYIKRRGTLQLIKNLEDETKAITSIQGLSEDEKNYMIEITRQMYYHMIFRSMQEEMPKDINEFISEEGRRIIPIMDYKEFFKEALNEAYRNKGLEFDGVTIPAEINQEIDRLVVEKKKKKVLVDLVEYLGMDGLKELIRSNRRMF